MTEEKLWQRIRERNGRERGFCGVRIEAGAGEADPGTPDLVLTAGERTRWVELKVWPESLSGGQRAWAVDRRMRGCDPVLVLWGLVRSGRIDRVGLVEWDRYVPERGGRDETLRLGWSGTVRDTPGAWRSRVWRG